MAGFYRIILSLMLAVGLVANLPGFGNPSAVYGQAGTGVIAYTPASKRNEIRLINPDGSGDHQIWSTGTADLEGADDIWSIAWRSDSGALAFASTHEAECSINHADVFTINANGSNTRRVTEGPSCAGLAAYPQGRVRVPIENTSFDSFTGFVYVQGASSAQIVNLPPGGNTVLTFENVADFGSGELQIATFFQGSRREINVGTAVDVAAGGSVTTNTLDVFPLSGYSVWETFSPTWRSGGQQIGYLFNYNSIRGISPTPAPLDFGSELITASQSDLPDFVTHLAYGPTSATANQLLYAGSTAFESETVFLVTEGSSNIGTPLVTHDFTEQILGLAWLPDGSGFVYSVMEFDFDPEYIQSANIFVYNFASKSTTPVTDLSAEFTGQLSVSPDGQQIVFERGAELDVFQAIVDPDLWIINRDGSGLHLLKAGAASPAWSPGDIQEAAMLDQHVYLPALVR